MRREVTGLREMLAPCRRLSRATDRVRPSSPKDKQPELSQYQGIMNSWALLAVVALASAALGQQQEYPTNTKYENFNTDSIIANERILLGYYKCVMDKGPCTKDGKNFKRVLPLTITTACSHCSPKQKTVVRRLLLGIRAKSEPRFMEMLDKYDPGHLNRPALFAFLVNSN